MLYRIAAMVIQSAWRFSRYKSSILSKSNHNVSSWRENSVRNIDNAATLIQLNWRRFCNKRIFRYFRELIKNRLHGEPADLLRVIAPGESYLLDKAAGVHIRFRLGGSIFPPKIYYKIYTHRPLCDINSFAPRYYSKEKPAGTFQMHNHESSIPEHVRRQSSIRVGSSVFGTLITTKDDKNWYQREENNEWRPISTQKIDELVTPFYDRPISQPIKSFHFSRIRRQEDINRERKLRKREWMMKAYMLTASGKNPQSPPKQNSTTPTPLAPSNPLFADDDPVFTQDQMIGKGNIIDGLIGEDYNYNHDDNDNDDDENRQRTSGGIMTSNMRSSSKEKQQRGGVKWDTVNYNYGNNNNNNNREDLESPQLYGKNSSHHHNGTGDVDGGPMRGDEDLLLWRYESHKYQYLTIIFTFAYFSFTIFVHI